MSASFNLQLASQAERRRRIIKLVLLIALIFLACAGLCGFWITQPLLSQPPLSRSAQVEPERLRRHVQTLSVSLAPRDESHVENLDRVANYIQREFEKSNGRVSVQRYDLNGKNYRNVIVCFGPETAERIVVGAHYDAAGPFPGADDNASGVAGVIELAHLLGAQMPLMEVELVAFTLEEPPYFQTANMGSAVHAASLRREGAKVRMMFSLEMIGCFSDESGSQSFPIPLMALFYPSKGNFIGVVGRFSDGLSARRVKRVMTGASPLPVYSISAPTLIPGIDFSDHMNYWKAGYDALMITDSAFYRNRYYHTSADTPEKLDYIRMAMVVEGVYAAILDLSH